MDARCVKLVASGGIREKMRGRLEKGSGLVATVNASICLKKFGRRRGIGVTVSCGCFTKVRDSIIP